MSKVYLKKCDKYNYEKIYSIIKDSIEELGGINKFIKPGEKVFLKANLLMAKKPEKGVTTHPIFIKAIANYLINENNNTVIVGDSPGGPYNKKALMKIYEECGYLKMIEKTQIKLNMNFESDKINFENGKLLNNLTVIKSILDVDKVISVAKLKTHGMMKYTGAVKNMFGVIPGVLKAEFHFRMPRVDDFSNMLIDVCLASKPVLSFIDGIVGMEGAGPSGGKLVESNVVLISSNPYELDFIATKLIKINPLSVPTINNSIKRNLSADNIENIEILGDSFYKFKIKAFENPKINKIDFLDNFLPNFISKRISNYLKPRPLFNYKKCIKCGICKEACPPNAILMEKKEYPKLIIDKCISCFCCQELCPQKAIDIKRLWILDKVIKD